MKPSKTLIVVLKNKKGYVAPKQEMEEINYNFYNKFCKLNLRKPTKGWGVELQGPSLFAKKKSLQRWIQFDKPNLFKWIVSDSNPHC